MHKSIKIIRIKIFILILLANVSFTYSIGAINKPEPITDEKLKQLGLDRNYHECISVADGDTVTLKDIGSVRFIGIDTPEKNHPKLPEQYWSKKASNFTRQLCLGKKVRIDYDPYDEDKRGKYGRVLGYLYLEDGTFIQEELIKNGYAIAYTKYPLDEHKKAQFLEWEHKARNNGIGLWKDDGFPEVLWILEQKQPLLQVTKLSKGKWRIGLGNWILESVESGDVESNLKQLYSSIYEFGPRELQAKLRELRYEIKTSNVNDPNKIFVIGMSHKKWGIIYKNYALPRVLPGCLDMQLEKLIGFINENDDDELREILSKNQYRIIPKHTINSVEPNNIAKIFLRIYEVMGTGKDLIPWDMAGNFVGRNMTVEGKITRTHNSGKACFLNFHNNFTRYMSLVIFARDFKKFPKIPEEYYLNKIVRIKGKVKIYKNKPEIILENPTQIEIIEDQIPIKSINKMENEQIEANQKSNSNSSSNLIDDKEFIYYIIKSGDSLSKLAKRYYGDPKKDYIIEKYNGLNNPNHIVVGQKIMIPKIGKFSTLKKIKDLEKETIQQKLKSNYYTRPNYINSKIFLIFIILMIGTGCLIYIIKKSRNTISAKSEKHIKLTNDLNIKNHSSPLKDSSFEETKNFKCYNIIEQENEQNSLSPMLEKDIQAEFGRNNCRSSREIWAALRANTTEDNLKQGVPVQIFSAICCYETEKAFCIRVIGDGKTLFLPKTQIKIEFGHVYFDREVEVTLTIPKWLAHKNIL